MRYNTPSSPLDNLRDFVRRGGTPVTLALLAANIVTFLAGFFSPRIVLPLLANYGVFDLSNVAHAPWTLLTYPLISMPSFSIMLVVYWVFFWLTGGSLERGWGSARFALFFFAVTLASSLSLLAGGLLLRHEIMPLHDIFLPLTGLVVAFCMLNPEQQMTVYFFQVRARYLAIGMTAFTYLTYGNPNALGPILGLFALGGIAAAYLYVRFARPWAGIGSYGGSRGGSQASFRGPDLRTDSRDARPAFRTTTTPDGSRRGRSPLDLAGRWKDWQERRRLEKLWKNSGFSSSEPEWRDDEKRRR